jgi:hypothetical protein
VSATYACIVTKTHHFSCPAARTWNTTLETQCRDVSAPDECIGGDESTEGDPSCQSTFRYFVDEIALGACADVVYSDDWTDVAINSTVPQIGAFGGPGGSIFTVGGKEFLVGNRPYTLDLGFNLSAIWGPSNDDLWIVGPKGAFARGSEFDGFSVGKLDVEDDLLAIDGLTSDDFWIAGTGGRIIHVIGEMTKTWTDADPSIVLRDVFVLDDGTAWIVGSKGRIYHWDGTEMHDVDGGTIYTGVYATGENDVYLSSQWVSFNGTATRSSI